MRHKASNRGVGLRARQNNLPDQLILQPRFRKVEQGDAHLLEVGDTVDIRLQQHVLTERFLRLEIRAVETPVDVRASIQRCVLRLGDRVELRPVAPAYSPAAAKQLLMSANTAATSSGTSSSALLKAGPARVDAAVRADGNLTVTAVR